MKTHITLAEQQCKGLGLEMLIIDQKTQVASLLKSSLRKLGLGLSL